MQARPYRPDQAGTTNNAPGRWHEPMAVLLADGTYTAGCADCLSSLASGVDEATATAAVFAHLLAANSPTIPEAALLGGEGTA